MSATKTNLTNPGGLARRLFRTGEEDEAIDAWLNPQKQQATLPPEAIATPEELFQLAEEFRSFYPDPASRPDWVTELLAHVEAIKAA